MIPRSAALLKALLARSEFTDTHVAEALDCSPNDLESFSTGQQVMPLNRQLKLAEFIIARVPALARRGHALKAQVSAATSFNDHDTSVHSEPPGRWTSRRR
jgi:hypothetical protein